MAQYLIFEVEVRAPSGLSEEEVKFWLERKLDPKTGDIITCDIIEN